MNNLKIYLIPFVIILALSACQSTAPVATSIHPTVTVPPTTVPTIPPTITVPPTTAPTIPPTPEPLDIKMLKNMTYLLPYSQKTVTLTDGGYKGGSGADYLEVGLSNIIGLGDLNGDGMGDAAVILAENTGGSGSFESLVVVLNRNGEPVQGAAAQIGDREKIEGLVIQEHLIALDLVVHAPNDPMCCPTRSETRTYALVNNNLVLTHLTSKTPDGKAREIRIESPAAGTQAGASLQVKGSVTIAPFENTLACRIYDDAGKLLTEGPIMVTASDMGEPGTFDASVDLSQVPSGITFRLEIADLSAADGSILAMDSLELARK